MTTLSSKTATLTAVIVLGSLMSTAAHAGVLRTAAGVPVMTKDGACVLTGTDGVGPEGCGLVQETPAPTVAKEVNHERVVYFDFNKSALTAHAKHHLDHLVKKLAFHEEHKHVKAPVITVVGYADRIGKADYNEKLAMKRAEAVRDYLRAKGIRAKKIEVRSLGKTAPKAECPADLPRAKLIDCLREDRRVEIEVSPSK